MDTYVLKCQIFIEMWYSCVNEKWISNLSYLNVIEMLKVHRLSQCPHTTNLLVMLILLENEECR